MLRSKKPAAAAVVRTFECCGAPYDPVTMGRLRLAGTRMWLCSACFGKATAADVADAARIEAERKAQVPA